MNGPITFEVPGRPVPNERCRRDPRSGRWYTPSKTRVFQKAVANYALVAHLKLNKGDLVRVRVEGYLSRRPWPDGDNVMKNILDGIQKACPAWNDRDAIKQTTDMYPAVDGQQFTRVTVEPLSR